MTEDKKEFRISQKLLFSLLVCIGLLIEMFFLVNIIKWRSSPDTGWIPMAEFGPKIIGYTSPLGVDAGLRKGDRILNINGKSYQTSEELGRAIDFRIGNANVYELERNGKIFKVSIVTHELGIKRVLIQSGLLWFLGMIFLGLGIIVFLMKPYHEASWAFLIMTLTSGIFITYMSPSYFYKPALLDSVLILIPPFLPASIVHLAVLFPQRRPALADRKWLFAIPYLISLILAVISRSLASRMPNMPQWIMYIIYFYMFASFLMFLGSTIYSYIRSSSRAVKLQSLIIVSGIIIALVIPMIEQLSNLIFNVSFFPNPIFFYLLFILFFPVSIGYAIVRHDLFEFDVIIRRTYGYVLSTASIVGLYALIISVLNVIFRSSDISRSPLFSLVFALGVVFFFRPLHERFQGFVDRVFYRQRYDYRKTIKDISEAMTSILDPGQIHRTLISSVVREMFLENGLLLLPDASKKVYHITAADGIDAEKLALKHLSENEALLQVIRENTDAVFRHDLDLHPQYKSNREMLRNTFQSLSSEVMLPMKYKDEMRGIISLGRKKSGKMFTQEDLDLLKTLVNQSVIAMENAKLFEENLEKGRMEEELKIAHDIQISMLPDKAPSIGGFAIAARSVPAREVGGDFYDFIEMRNNGNAEKLGIVVGDVSGKAVSGALVMAASRSIFRVLGESRASVEEIMSVGNIRLNRDIKKGMFVALVYAVLDSRQKTLTLSNAGQTQPVLCPRDKSKPAFIDTDGDRFPLGIIKDCDYKETQVPLKKWDTIVFYTDGIIEAMNEKKELYGFERFFNSIEAGRDLDANALLEKLVADVMEFAGNAEQHDDLTLVVVKVE